MEPELIQTPSLPPLLANLPHRYVQLPITSPILLARHNGPLVATTLLTEVEAHRVECSDCC